MSDQVIDDRIAAAPDGGDAAPPPLARTRSRLIAALSGLANDLVQRLLAEQDRWVLWLPVGLGIGICLYFILPTEPPLGTGAAGLVVALLGLGWGLGLGSRSALVGGMALLVVALGFTAIQVRTLTMLAPVLERELGPVAVTGRVAGVEALPEGTRLVLAEVTIARLPADRQPARVRLRLSPRFPAPIPGAVVRVRAMVRPPPAPAAPGAYDFQRAAFFDGIGAVGWAVAAPEPVAGPLPSWWQGWASAIEQLRGDIAVRVARVVDPPAAAVTAALLNGSQVGIDAATMTDYRNSGLAHILSVSGLHIALVAGLVFFVVRALLALIEPIALRFPIKKWAALSGLIAASAYMALVGAQAPTLRSVLMHGFAMLAIMLDRSPLSLRLWAIAAAAVLLLQPDSVLGPSFQMSFGAVLALIATCEAMEGRLRGWRLGSGWLGRAGLWLFGSVLTSATATAATMPFSIYHFQQMAFYGILANMLAVPLTSFWVMPWALIAYCLMPFGLEAWALVPMGWGVVGVNLIAHWTASLPGASQLFPAMPAGGLIAIVAGGLWLCLWRGGWRWWGLAVICAGFATLVVTPRPDLLIAGDGRLIAVRGNDGGLWFSGRTGMKFAGETWLHRDGASAAAGFWPQQGASPDGTIRCDGLGCIYRRGGETVALIKEAQALPEDCAGSTVVVFATGSARRCRAATVIDRWRLRREGAIALYLEPGKVRLDSVHARRGDRPWTGPAAATGSQ